LKDDLIHHGSFDELCLWHRGHDFNEWLVPEYDATLRRGVHITREREARKVSKEPIRKEPQALEIRDRCLVEREGFEKAQNVVQASGDEVVSVLRQSPNEQAEDRLSFHRLFKVRLHHRQLVQVRQKSLAHVMWRIPSRWGLILAQLG
jgi:hypothetical protein